MHAEFLYNPPGAGLHCHAASLMETPSGDLLAVWYAYPDVEHHGGSLIMARRPAGQIAWQSGSRVFCPSNYSAGNPVLFQGINNRIGLLFVFLKGEYWNDAELQGSWSDDDGITWSTPTTLWKERGMMVRHPPVRLNDGRLLLPAYDERKRQSVLLSSSPPYSNWEFAYCFEDPPLLQPVLIRTGPSLLSIFFRPWDDPRQIWKSRSSNDGKTWSAPIRTPLPCPLSGIAAFASESTIGVVYNHTHEHQRFPLSIALSNDDGIRWSEPRHLENITLEVSYPAFMVSPTRNQIEGVYTFNRRMIKHVSFALNEVVEP